MIKCKAWAQYHALLYDSRNEVSLYYHYCHYHMSGWLQQLTCKMQCRAFSLLEAIN